MCPKGSGDFDGSGTFSAIESEITGNGTFSAESGYLTGEEIGHMHIELMRVTASPVSSLDPQDTFLVS